LMPSASVETLPGTSSCVKEKVVCAIAEAPPNARKTTKATIAKEILRAFIFFSFAVAIVAGCGNGKSKSTVNKKNLNARMGKSERHEKVLRSRAEEALPQ
jgi:hypothetical protein